MKTTKRNFVISTAIGALVATLGACDPADDPDPGGDTDGSGAGTGGPNDGDGQFLRCCYFAANSDEDGRNGCVPQNSAFHPCVDPSDPELDHDGSGTLDIQEMSDICDAKVPNDISVLNPWSFPLLPPDESSLLDIQGPWVAANSTGGNLFGACVPDLDPETEFPGAEPPTHEGTFSSGSPHSSSAGVSLNGVHRVMKATGQFELAISDCEPVRHLQTCHLELRALGVDLEGPAAFKDYSVDTAFISLSEVTATSVILDCSDGASCVGSFDFSTRTGTSLETLLQWDQTNLSTGSVGGGSLRLGADGLASMSRVLGELDLDIAMEKGVLRLRGSGSDAYDGAFASIDFDIAGPVSPYTVP